MSEPVEAFSSQRLEALVGDDAERYLANGFVEAASAEYRRPNTPELLLRIEIFQLGSRLGAFTALADQVATLDDPSQAEAPGVLELREAGHISPGNLIFFKGNYFVRLILQDLSPHVTEERLDRESREHLPPIAGVLAQAIPGSSDPPDELTPLPREGRVRRSERYYSNRLLELEALGAGVSALYGDPGPRFQLGIAAGLDEAGAQGAFDALAASLQGASPLNELGDQAVMGELADGRHAFVARRAEGLALALQLRGGARPNSRTVIAILGAAIDPNLEGGAEQPDDRPWLKRRDSILPSQVNR
jgi:hypothetical protein